jgi:hypothetical protein
VDVDLDVNLNVNASLDGAKPSAPLAIASGSAE